MKYFSFKISYFNLKHTKHILIFSVRQFIKVAKLNFLSDLFKQWRDWVYLLEQNYLFPKKFTFTHNIIKQTNDTASHLLLSAKQPHKRSIDVNKNNSF